MSTTNPQSKAGRWIIVVIGALLMIAFIMPLGMNGGGQGGRDFVMGEAFDEDVTTGQVQDARARWEAAQSIALSDGGTLRPIASALLPQEAVAAIDAEPLLYELLLREADHAGVEASDELLTQVLTLVQVAHGGQMWPINALPTPQETAMAATTVSELLRIQQSFARHHNFLFVSQPVVNAIVQQRGRLLTLELVPFSAAPHENDAIDPSAEQLQTQFETYKDTLPGQVSPGNPLGFGYRQPNRLGLNVLRLTRESAEQSVRASKSDFDWTVEARRYYNANTSEFVADPSTTQPSTQPAATQPSSSSEVQSFEEVRDAIIARLVDEAAQQKLMQAASFAHSRLTAQHLQQADTPAPLDISELANQTQSRYGVTLETEPLDERTYTLNELSEMPSLAMVTSPDRIDPRTGLNFTLPQMAFLMAEPLQPEDSNAPSLRIGEPSPVLQDFEGSMVLFRINKAEPAHTPESLDAVRDAVARDVRLNIIADRTADDARQLLTQAAGGPLSPHAGDRRVIETTPFTVDTTAMPLPDDALPQDVSTTEAQAFAQQAFNLSDAGGVIRLPSAGLVYAARVTASEPITQQPGVDLHQMYRAAIAEDLRSGLQLNAADRLRSLPGLWFDPESIRLRTGFDSEDEAPAS